MTQMMALGVETPQISTVGNFNAAQSNAIQQKGALFQQEQAAHQAIAEHALGVMGGRLDGPVNPDSLKQWIGMLGEGDAHSKALAAQLQANPNLVPVLAKGSLSVLQAGQDQQKIDLAQNQYELDLKTAAEKGRFVEMSPGGTLHDTTGATPDYTAPNKPADNAYRMMTPDEVKAAGLPEGAYQIDDVDKKIYPISGGGGNGITITNPDGTTTQIGGKGGNAYDTAEGKGLYETGQTIAKDGRAATTQLATLDKMAELLANDKVYTGPGADQVKQLQRAAVSLFGADPSGIQDTESFNALTKKAVLDVMGGSLGPGVSNGDRDYIDGQQPSMDNTKAGNLLLIDITKKVAQRKVDIAKFAADYKKGHGGKLDWQFDDALATWAEANPMFGDAGGGGKKSWAPVSITDDAGYAKLASGTDFMGPDGHVRTKP